MTAKNEEDSYEIMLDDMYSEDNAKAHAELKIRGELPKPVDIVDQFMYYLTHKRTYPQISSLLTEYDITQIEHLPQGIHIHGCLKCAWKQSIKCPFAYKRKNTMPFGGICKKRKVWLCYVGGYWPEKPRIAQWTERFLKNKLILEADSDLTKLELLNEKVRVIESDRESTKEDKQEIRRHRSEAKTEWLEVMKLLLPSESRQVEREMPKKIEIETKKVIDLGSIHQIMREGRKAKEEIIDAKFTKKEENEN